MPIHDPLDDLSGAWDAAPAPLSPAQRAFFALERRLIRRRWQGAGVWSGLLLSQIPTWWQLNRDYNQVWGVTLVAGLHAFVLWLALRPSLPANRAAFGLCLPFLIITSVCVFYRGGCGISPYLPEYNLWLMPLLFGATGLHLGLKSFLAGHLDPREYLAFVHWHRALNLDDPLQTPAPTPVTFRADATPPAGRLFWIFGLITTLLLLPFSAMAVREMLWQFLWH